MSRLVIKDTKDVLMEKSVEMSQLRSQNGKINQFYKDCSFVMKKSAEELEKRLVEDVIISNRDNGKTYLNEIKKNVKSYIAIKNCSDCVPEVKEEVMERHERAVNDILVYIDFIKNELSVFNRIDSDFEVQRYLKT